MKVILMERIRNCGTLGEEVKVANGFARNYLFPTGKAVRATKENRLYFEERRASLEAAARKTQAEAEERAQQLSGTEISIQAKASQEGKLYGSVGAEQIAEALAAENINIQKNEIKLPAGNLHEVGEHQVGVQLHASVSINIAVVITAE